jgi:transposase
MTIVILGIDLGKNSCSVVGLDESGAVVLRRRMRRQTILGFAAKLPACVVAMEACCGAHYLGRLLTNQGHTVKLMSPEYVRPYVKAQKNDDRDAEAIAEAASRPTMRFVELKSEEQLDTQTLHRVRSRLVAARKTLLNQLRAILLERGHIFPQGRRKLDHALESLVDDPAFAVSRRMRQLVIDMRAEWQDLDRRIAALNAEFVELVRSDAAARRLTSIPGIGVLNATALVAAVGDASAFRRGRVSEPGSGWCRSNTSQEASRSCSASASAATSICGCSSSMALGRRCRRLPKARPRSGPGCAPCWPEPIATSSSWPSPTSWPGSPGRC